MTDFPSDPEPIDPSSTDLPYETLAAEPAVPAVEADAAVEPDSISDAELLDAAAQPFEATADLPGDSDSANDTAPPTDTAHDVPPNTAAQNTVPPNAAPLGSAPPPGYAPPIRRIYRSRHDRRIGGVSAGIAEYFRIDPTIVRFATLVTAITGIGLIAYFVAWFIIPVRPEGYVEYRTPTNPSTSRTGTIGLGVVAFAVLIGIINGSAVVTALALIAGGIWLLSEHANNPAVAPAGMAPAGMAPAFSEPARYAAAPEPNTAGSYEPGYEYSAPTPAPAANVPPAPVWEPQAPPVPRQKQRITWIVLSLLALLMAVGIVASAAELWNVSATRFLGIGVILIGLGVVAGQLRNGGARGLIPLGILAALALFPVSAVDGLLDEGIGESSYRPVTVEELADTYEHGIGQMTVDLSALDLEGTSKDVDIDLGIGELIVIVPRDAGGQAVLEVKAGEASYETASSIEASDNGPFRFRQSVNHDDGINVDAGPILLTGDNGSLTLNISVGFGVAELQLAGSR